MAQNDYDISDYHTAGYLAQWYKSEKRAAAVRLLSSMEKDEDSAEERMIYRNDPTLPPLSGTMNEDKVTQQVKKVQAPAEFLANQRHYHHHLYEQTYGSGGIANLFKVPAPPDQAEMAASFPAGGKKTFPPVQAAMQKAITQPSKKPQPPSKPKPPDHNKEGAGASSPRDRPKRRFLRTIPPEPPEDPLAEHKVLPSRTPTSKEMQHFTPFHNTYNSTYRTRYFLGPTGRLLAV
eukprot:TRINITY_DN76368_c0_g1_i2.p2 TRINITY_DN76368_c0_g1~~TRINITY_DN76368_c0_g1_i2.p2  ORF type:complete len:234 (-),score=26.90 TRINITY_DN76368_c0_g1_i2:1097-1798(-)